MASRRACIVLVVSREELIVLKRASGRPRELLDAERLLEA